MRKGIVLITFVGALLAVACGGTNSATSGQPTAPTGAATNATSAAGAPTNGENA